MKEAEFLAGIKQRLNVTAGLIGDAATFLHAQVFDKFPIDFIIKGDEPEAVVDKINDRDSYKNVKGVLYMERGSIRDSGEPETIHELDKLPFPRWDLFPISVYRYFPILRRTPFLPVLSTRGCPYGCIYCPYTSNQGLNYRCRSPQNVVDELLHLKKNYRVKAIQFRDPTFTLRKDRVIEICDGIIQNNLKIEWGCETRPDCLDDELIAKMVKAGMKGVNLGIESSDPDIIRNLKRGWIDPDHIRRIVSQLVSHGVRVSGFFILGLPGENRRTIERTLQFAAELPLSYAEFKIATPFPGTPLFEMAKANRWIEDVRIEDFTSYIPTMRISQELDSEYLKTTSNRAYKSFYMRPKKIMKELVSESFISNLSGVMLKR
jgi:radical SAM superfamily enzyme YgiQ (UPF0313 family)